MKLDLEPLFAIRDYVDSRMIEIDQQLRTLQDQKHWSFVDWFTHDNLLGASEELRMLKAYLEEVIQEND